MAEVKNAFIKSKMNKDLDARLLPSGEYRDAINVQVSRSEGSDVGALENVLGNYIATPSNQSFEQITNVSNLILVGCYENAASNTVFLFFTNNNEEAYNPNKSNFIFSYNVSVNIGSAITLLAEGSYLNFSSKAPIIGINLIENLLFFTDNRNQPRKINISLASNNYYDSEEKISVATYNPFQAIQLYEEKQLGVGSFVTTMQDPFTELLPNGDPNPYYNEEFPGDPDFLKDKFVRFSYRFKFVDGEYSIFAPFTQEAFIPEQDGYFLNQAITGQTDTVSDEEEAYRSSVVDFMQNKVSNIKLIIPLPLKSIPITNPNGDIVYESILAENLFKELNISEIDILYKESDGIAVSVIDTITQQEILDAGGVSFLTYDYQSRKPYKTLPENQTVRVYDKVPVKAFGQEIISNRVVYSNFQDKHTPPQAINYDVGIYAKDSFSTSTSSSYVNPTFESTSIVEYPTHTVKQNRNYQVGIILSDKYGRSSTTILSAVTPGATTSGGNELGGSTIYHPYADETTYNATSWPGDSIKILFNDQINSDVSTDGPGAPGLYNGDPSSDAYNPLGWYSYKVVVKQNEQEYYNVYTPGILNGYPNVPTELPDPQNTIAFITLLSDNINKVPRDLTEVGPEQKQYRSAVRLYCRVTPESTNNPSFNSPYFPFKNDQTVAAIAEQDNMLEDSTSVKYSTVYQTESDPYLARLIQGNVDNNPIGSLPPSNPDDLYNIYLGVFETNPVVSRLNIYWETSTSGLISDLNQAINTDTGQNQDLFNWEFFLNENMNSGTRCTSYFSILDSSQAQPTPILNSNLTLNSVRENNGLGSNISKFVLEPIAAGNPDLEGNVENYNRYYLKTDGVFAYVTGSDQTDVYEIIFNDTTTNTIITVSDNTLINADPIITNCPSNNPAVVENGATDVYQFEGVNGSAATQGAQEQDIDWYLGVNTAGQPDISPFEPNLNWLITENGLLKETTGQGSGLYQGSVQLIDAGGNIAYCNFQVILGESLVNDEFSSGGQATGIYYQSENSAFGVYWVGNADNALVNPSMDRTLNGANSNSLELDSIYDPNDPSSSNQATWSQDCSSSSSQNYEQEQLWYNENYPSWFISGISTPTDLTDTKTNLTKGTAFITLEIVVNGAGSNNIDNILNSTSFIGKLQYRDPNGAGYPNNWVQAIDVEGQPCVIGGITANGTKVSKGAASTYSTINQQGNTFAKSSAAGQQTNGSGSFDYNKGNFILAQVAQVPYGSYSDQHTFYNAYNAGNNYDVGDVAQDINRVIKNFSFIATSNVIQKTFVVGESQYYNKTTYHGDYRLEVFYADSFMSKGYGGDCNTGWKFPRPSGGPGGGCVANYCNDLVNPKVFNPFGDFIGGSGADAFVSFGDFYYPDGPIDSRLSYTYEVGNQNSNTNVDAINKLFSTGQKQTVYAREWHMQYVSQFYKDAGLSQPFTGDFGNGSGLYAYKQVNDYAAPGLQTTLPTAITSGTNQASVGKGEATNGPTYGAPQSSPFDRKWLAQFDANGIKTEGSAIPNIYPTLWDADEPWRSTGTTQ